MLRALSANLSSLEDLMWVLSTQFLNLVNIFASLGETTVLFNNFTPVCASIAEAAALPPRSDYQAVLVCEFDYCALTGER